jgi:hypothetical protein
VQKLHSMHSGLHRMGAGVSTFTQPIQCSRSSTATAPAQELAASWQPISFTVAAVQLIGRADFHEPFRIRWEVPLGGQQQPTRVDVPYVATAGDTVAPPGGLVSCLASRRASCI